MDQKIQTHHRERDPAKTPSALWESVKMQMSEFLADRKLTKSVSQHAKVTFKKGYLPQSLHGLDTVNMRIKTRWG
jgi:hypothetical protein